MERLTEEELQYVANLLENLIDPESVQVPRYSGWISRIITKLRKTVK